jgi:hypothetical protein
MMCVTYIRKELFIEKSRVVYRGGTGSFFGIGILPVSDLVDFRYFGRYY